MAVDFINTINKTGEDYGDLTTWEAAIQSDFTSAQTRVYTVSSVTGTVADGATVIGDTNSYTATVRHCNVVGTSPRKVLVYHDTASETFANNEVIRVDADNYITLSATAGDTDDTAVCIAEVYDDDGVLDDALLVDGSTQNVTNYIKVTVPSGDRHNGTATSGARVNRTPTAGNAHTLQNLDSYTVFEWLIVSLTTGGTTTGDGNNAIYCDRSTTTVNNCVIFLSGTPASGCADWNGIEVSIATSVVNNYYFYNNIIYGFTNSTNEWSGITVNTDTTRSNKNFYIYNNTVYNCDLGIEISDAGGSNSASFVYNNLVIGCDTDFTWHGTYTEDYNASSDATAAGAHDINSGSGDPPVAGDFVNAGTGDFHLNASTPEINTGTNLGGGLWDTDIDGRDRDTEGDTWDIGADEYVTSGIPPTYTKQICDTLPDNIANLSTEFTETEYTNVLTDDSNYVNLE